MRRLLAAVTMIVVFGSPSHLLAKPNKQPDHGVCAGFTGAARALCENYCVTKNCPAQPGPSCDEMRKNFAKQTGTTVLPCDIVIGTATPNATTTPKLGTPIPSASPSPQATASPGNGACPTALEFRPGPNLGELDVGWTGLGHDQPLLIGGSLSFAVGCSGPSQPCGVCALKGPIPNSAADQGDLNNQRCAAEPSKRCTRDTDCSPGDTCTFFFGAPVPLSAGGVSTCVVNRIDGEIDGSVDLDTGDASVLVNLVAQVSNGDVAAPCPTCDGDVFINDGKPEGFCSGGARAGLACDIGGFSPVPSFGNTSLDCPPSPGAVIGNLPLVWDLTTGTATRTLTDASPDCTGVGPPARCFCPAQNEATRPNACLDGLCVPQPQGNDDGICPAGPVDSVCSIEHFRGCLSNNDCPFPGDVCVSRERECYLDNGVVGGTVAATGHADPFDANNSAQPTFAALFCVPRVSSAAVNQSNGLPGLGRLLLPGIFNAAASLPSCDSGERSLTLTTAPGGDLDYGWTGISHNQTPLAEAVLPLPLTGCGPNPGDDCSVDGSALVGTPFGSPLPLSAGGVSSCVTNEFREAITGTYDCGTGCGESSVKLISRVFLVLDQNKPCPPCVGDPTPNDGVKGGFCDGGKTPGAACDVGGISDLFQNAGGAPPDAGRTSNDCQPTGSSVGELNIDLNPLTTGTASVNANVNCLSGAFPPGSCFCTGQVQPNACVPDGVCPASGVCEQNPPDGVCSGQTYRQCDLTAGNRDCEDTFPGSGNCEAQPRPCFGGNITRTGTCGAQASELVSVFCVPATRAAAINTVSGLPGPAALALPVTTSGCLCEGGPPADNPPDCSNASASSDVLWPPNHKWEEVRVDGVTDPDGDPVSITITGITQDEPTNGRGDGDTCPDAEGVGTSVARVRAERIGSRREGGDGRVYHVSFLADDGRGGQCTGSVNVCVPHDRGKGGSCGDQGSLIDSAGACGATGGGSTTVRFTANATTNLQGFRLDVTYPTAKGGFTGSGGAVNCSTTSSGLLVGNDLDNGTLILLLASVSDLSFPLDITCTFDEAAGQNLTSSDIGVTVTEVVGAPGDPGSLLVVDVDVP